MRRTRSVFSPAGRGKMGRLALGVAVATLFAPVAAGQMFRQRPTVLTNARIITGDGDVIETGSILIQQGRIVAIGSFNAPENARTVDVAGGTVTPGFIDAAGSLGLTSASAGGGPTHDVLDRLNPYSYDDFTDALRNGVTTVALPATAGTGVEGQGAVIQLVRSRRTIAAESIDDRHTLCIDLASGSGAVQRLSLFDGLRKQFRDAVEYRKTVELYEDEQLPEYLEKIEERAKKKEEGEGGDDSGDGETEDGNGEGDAPNPARRRRPGGGGGGGAANDQISMADDQDPSLQQPPRPVRGGRGGRGGRGAGSGQRPGGNGNNGDGINKPQQPARNPNADVLLQAIDHELPVVITAQNSADILNALELADEFGLSITILGGGEAHDVADALAEAEVPVILTTGLFDDDLAERIRALEDADVTWTIGTGGRDSRALLPAAQMVAGASDVDAIELLTARAAAALGLPENAARIARGSTASVVVWSGDPLDPGSRVDTVYVNGRMIYEARNDEDDQEGNAP